MRQIAERLCKIPQLTVSTGASLSRYTRFGIGGPAALLCDTADEAALIEALQIVQASGVRSVLIGGGSNLVVADEGFGGIVMRYTGSQIQVARNEITAQAGAVLQDVVDRSIASGLQGLETMTGIPGFLGGAVYGNAGAYGHSLQEFVEAVRFFEEGAVRVFDNTQCEFRYRESAFKKAKARVILSATLRLTEGDGVELQRVAAGIRAIRDEKYPPSMKCAGSIFKNLFFDELPEDVQQMLPPKVVREGKVPSAWFLEQVGVKGLRRGDIQVAAYHANLIYNDGAGTAADLVWVIEELKRRVRERFGFEIEEEVQYVGF
jgi:UDP-N-acetylmuramate dehydrogenase